MLAKTLYTKFQGCILKIEENMMEKLTKTLNFGQLSDPTKHGLTDIFSYPWPLLSLNDHLPSMGIPPSQHPLHLDQLFYAESILGLLDHLFP